VIDYKITGGKELEALMQQLPVEVETKILRNGLAAGANIIRDEAKARIHKKSGETAAAIKTSRSTDKAGGQVIAKVSLSKSRRYIGYFLEYGVAAHRIWVGGGKGSLVINGVPIGKQVMHPGFAPMPFLRPALDAKAGEAVQAVANYLTSHVKWGTISSPPVSVDLEEAA
jgi:HK97 gp10 family phage protein